MSTPKRGRASTLIGALLMVLAIVLISTAGRSMYRSMRDAAAQSPFATPGTTTVDLEPGRHIVYDYTAGTPAPLGPANVAVVGPDGLPVVTAPVVGDAGSFRSNGWNFTGVAGFEVPAPGTYQITVDAGQAGVAGQALVMPDLEETARGLEGPVLVGMLGGVIGFLGLVLFIVGQVRSHRSQAQPLAAGPYGPYGPTAGYGAYGTPAPLFTPPDYRVPAMVGAAAPSNPPAGWYPDAYQPGMSRWWDGQGWTEHVR